MISVLYVDDDPALRELIKLHLERTKLFRVETIGSARIAIQKIAETEYDAIVSDYHIPGMDGMELLREIRKEYPRLPFIIFTGRGRDSLAIEALNSGADYYLQKGIETKTLFARLRTMIQTAVERRRQEEGVADGEKRDRTVRPATVEFITRYLPDNTQIFANEAFCQYFGKNFLELVGKRFIPEIPEEDRPRVREHFSALTRERPCGTREHRVLLPDGRIRWQEWNDRAIFDKDGELREYESVGRDITDERGGMAPGQNSDG